MSTFVALWWLSFWTALGLCLGSFLNAVIYRIPRRKSLRAPLWSACPHCRRRIAWYDNIPILSFVLLGGRCRHCAVPIATRYVTIEAMTAVVVLMLLDGLLIGQSRLGLSTSEFGLTDRLSVDWPILTAHVILFACLLAMSAIDLEHYWVDIRFTNVVTLAGFALHTLWTPRHSLAWVRPGNVVGFGALAALAGLGLAWIVRVCQPHPEPENAPTDGTECDESARTETGTASHPPPSLASPSRAAGWALTLTLIGTFGALMLVEVYQVPIRHAARALVPLVLFFVLVVSESAVERDSDHAILEAIHEERHTARRVVLAELLSFLPAIAFAAIAVGVILTAGELSERIGRTLQTEFHIPQWALLRAWRPLYGLATASAGFVIAGGVGWAVRIVFTLAFGKEAFGTGDIHLMAAAGAVAGWPVVVLGFFLTCGVATVGWLLTLPFKRTRALPLGPWLSLSILAVVIFYEPIVHWPPLARSLQALDWMVGGGATSIDPGISR